MYPDPQRIRKHRLTLRLDTYEKDVLKALARYKGDQLSTLVREAAMRDALQLLESPPATEQRTA